MAGEMADHHRGGGTGDAFHVVVLGNPEALVAEGFHVAGKGRALLQRLTRSVAVANGNEIENRELRHRFTPVA